MTAGDNTNTSTAPAPTEVAPHIRVKSEDTKTAFDGDRYGRARTHFNTLGDVKGSDAFKGYERNWLASFFGANAPEPFMSPGPRVHPCKLFSNEVHRCLERNSNDFLLCQTRVANFQQCLKEFGL